MTFFLCAIICVNRTYDPTTALAHVSLPLSLHLPLTRHINKQHQPQHPLQRRIPRLRRLNRPPDQPTLTTDSQRVQHEERIIPQPGHPLRHASIRQVHSKVAVPYNLRDTPRDQHGRISWRAAGGSVREVVNDAPDEEKAGCDLHESGEEWCADDACRGGKVELSFDILHEMVGREYVYLRASAQSPTWPASVSTL